MQERKGEERKGMKTNQCGGTDAKFVGLKVKLCQTRRSGEKESRRLVENMYMGWLIYGPTHFS